MLDTNSKISAFILCLNCTSAPDERPLSQLASLLGTSLITSVPQNHSALTNLKFYFLDSPFLKFFEKKKPPRITLAEAVGLLSP